MRRCAWCGESRLIEALGEGVLLCAVCARTTRPGEVYTPPKDRGPDPRVPYDIQGFDGGAPED